jgi:hypothetical protein
MTALARTNTNWKRQTHPLLSDRAAHINKPGNVSQVTRIWWSLGPLDWGGGGLTPRQIDRLTVGRDLTLTLTRQYDIFQFPFSASNPGSLIYLQRDIRNALNISAIKSIVKRKLFGRPRHRREDNNYIDYERIVCERERAAGLNLYGSEMGASGGGFVNTVTNNRVTRRSNAGGNSLTKWATDIFSRRIVCYVVHNTRPTHLCKHDMNWVANLREQKVPPHVFRCSDFGYHPAMTLSTYVTKCWWLYLYHLL